jgi:hypothetical protein
MPYYQPLFVTKDRNEFNLVMSYFFQYFVAPEVAYFFCCLLKVSW